VRLTNGMVVASFPWQPSCALVSGVGDSEKLLPSTCVLGPPASWFQKLIRSAPLPYHIKSIVQNSGLYNPLKKIPHSVTASLTHSWSRALLEKPPSVQLLKNFPAFYGTRRFIAVFTITLHWFHPEPDQSNPYHPILSL
jgi:hypothetical protein